MRACKSVSFIHKHSKFIMAGAIVILFLGLFILGTSNKHAGATTHNIKYFTCINVEQDDTLWSIAKTYMSSEYTSINDYIDEVKSINNLSTDKIYYGASLVVPYYAAP